MIGLDGRTALVSGGGAGIGRAIVETFVKLGARLVVAEINPAHVAELRDSLAAADVEAEVIEADVRRQADVDRVAEAADRCFGGLDILVNNVGNYLMLKPFAEQTDNDWEAVYDINLRQMFRVTRAALPLLLRNAAASTAGSSIINISSIEAFRGIPLTSVYSSCKHAITGFTRCLALELGQRGIRVNAVAPETTETETVEPSKYVAAADRDHLETWFPLRRFGRAGDVAGSVAFLASDLSSWITGATINVDGGALAAGGRYRDRGGTWTSVPKIEGPGFTGYYN